MKIKRMARLARSLPSLFATSKAWRRSMFLTEKSIQNRGVECFGTFALPPLGSNDFKIDLSENIHSISDQSINYNEEKTYKLHKYNIKSLNHSFNLSQFINMKRLLVLVALFASLSTTSFAQIANLNITLSDVLSFSVTQPGSLDVNFDTEEKYNNGIAAFASDHVSVTSSRGYVVKAIAGTVTGPSSISPGTVKITSTIGATNNGNVSGISYGSAVILPETNGTAATVISAANSSWNGSNSTNKFNISYLIGAGGVYAGKPTGLNVVPVVYTVIQQ